MKRIVLLAMLVCYILSPALVYADPAVPDNIELSDVYVTHNLLETDDMLIYGLYTVDYAVLPDTPINKTMIFRLMANDGVTELGSNLAYPYHDLGYGEGVFSFYFPAATAPAWEGNYFVRLCGNPVYFPTTPPVPVNYPITSMNYSLLDNVTDNRLETKNNIMAFSETLSTDWPDTLWDTSDAGKVLSEKGDLYFTSSIPGLRSLCPGLFLVQMNDPDYTARTWDTTKATEYQGRFAGTWVGDAMNALGSFFGKDASMIGVIITVAACLVAIIASIAIAKSPRGGLICCGLILPVSTAISWFPPMALGLIFLLCILYGAAKIGGLIT